MVAYGVWLPSPRFMTESVRYHQHIPCQGFQPTARQIYISANGSKTVKLFVAYANFAKKAYFFEQATLGGALPFSFV